MEGWDPVVVNIIWIHTPEKLGSREGEILALSWHCSKYPNFWLRWFWLETLSVRFKLGMTRGRASQACSCLVQGRTFFHFYPQVTHQICLSKVLLAFQQQHNICIFTPFLNIFKIEYFIKNKGSWISLILLEPGGREEEQKISLKNTCFLTN